ncbi:MAG: hypothetical protein ACHBN1_35340 [Heteroscytonema crispum UTEX LB 1556]
MPLRSVSGSVKKAIAIRRLDSEALIAGKSSLLFLMILENSNGLADIPHLGPKNFTRAREKQPAPHDGRENKTQ